jgi:hypothetical protein
MQRMLHTYNQIILLKFLGILYFPFSGHLLIFAPSAPEQAAQVLSTEC